MIYALNLADDGRILSVTYDQFAPSEQPRVEELPDKDDDVTQYRYVDGEYIYEPLPVPEQPERQPTQEERITALEEQNAILIEKNDMLMEQNDMLTACVLEISEILYA